MHDFKRRETHGLVFGVYENRRWFFSFVDGDNHDDSIADAAVAVARARGGVNVEGTNESPIAARAPVAIEIGKKILRVLVGVLLPIGIGDPDAVRGFVVPVHQRRKEPGSDALFGIIAEHPGKDAEQDKD